MENETDVMLTTVKVVNAAEVKKIYDFYTFKNFNSFQNLN